MKILFCTNCGKSGHTSNKCRLLLRETCIYCSKVDHTKEYCPSRQLDNLRQDFEKPHSFLKPRTPMLLDRQSWDNKARGWHVRYDEHPRTQTTLGVAEAKGNEASVLNQDPWRKSLAAKEVSTLFTLYSNTRNTGHNKLTGLQDINITSASTRSNHLEISRTMEKISKTNQLLAQQQIAQQKALQVLLYCQEQTSKVQEASQRIQSQALMALTKVTQQRGFDPLFNKIAKYDGKDPEKCHYWLNQVRVACMESGRNFHQSLIFCAEDTVLAVLSGLNPGLTDKQVKEEIMRCFSPAPTRRQAIEKLRAMHQEPDEQMCQYIVRNEVAHLWAHRLAADEQCNTIEIIEFAINLQPFVQDKLLKKIDGNRLPRSLREAYD